MFQVHVVHGKAIYSVLQNNGFAEILRNRFRKKSETKMNARLHFSSIWLPVSQTLKKLAMSMRNWLLAVLLLLVAATHVSAQTRKLSGKIVAENNAVGGATIHIKGSSAHTVAGDDGSFSINVPDGNCTLVVSAVGYETRETEITPSTPVPVTISLKETVKGLNEVVVVGYGTSKKKDLTGSVSTISMTNTDRTPVVGTSQLLQGQASGVQVTQTNSQPGSSFTVRIRGTNSITTSSDPLYVIDGYAGGDISTINPSDIASIDVLKDASATAIYGSRGANGVVMITTKRGMAGRNAISFDMYTGFQHIGKKLDMMNAKQFATYLNNVTTLNNQNNGTSTALPYTQAQIDSMGTGTDWQDEIFRRAPISNYTLGFSGGNTDTRYFLSMNFFNQKGIIIGSDYKRGTLRFNIDRKISDKLRMGVNSQVSYDFQNQANVNTNGGSAGGTLLDALRMSPIVPVYDKTGAFTFQNFPQPYVNILGNPVAAAMLNSDKVRNIRLLVNGFVEYEMLKGLKLRSSLGVDYRNGRENTFRPSTTYLGLQSNGYAQIFNQENYNWLNENTISYDKQINRIHAINAVAGFTVQQWQNNSSTVTGTNLSSNNFSTDNTSVAGNLTSSSNTNSNALVSFLGRVNYRLMDKYLFTFSMRADGSSRFGTDRKWGYFPSGAFAWRVSDEDFIKNIKAISDLKFRASYGVTGNQEIPSYLSLKQYGTNTYFLNGGRVTGISPNNVPNSDLHWEPTSAFDIGFDLGLLNNRLSISADYYHKTTSDLLYNMPIPSTSGFTSMIQNIARMQNKGFEFSISTTNIDRKKIKWVTSANFSTNANKILDLGGVNSQLTGNVSSSLFPSGGQYSSILQVGKPIGSFYGYKFGGIWQTQDEISKSGTKQNVRPGDPIYLDLNGDSALTAADRTIIGRALPKFTYGFTSNLTVGRFNLFVLVQGVYGSNILNENRIEMENGTIVDNKFAYVGNESWTGPGTSNTLPSVVSTLRRTVGVTSDIIESGSYLRFKTITLSYDLPLPKLTSVFKSASVYVTGQNLITITKYSGYDPEVNSYPNSSGNYTSLNTDYNPYPNVRTYLVGVKFGF
jgi:TonB-linked SusC/RagA family outer membrane protein